MKHEALFGGAREIARIGLAVALITVCAWISLPVGAIPVTLQTFAVALVGGLLDWRRGLFAVIAYLLMGLCGIPVFAGFRGGAALFSTTGGYILGFAFLALFPALAKRLPVSRPLLRMGIFYLAMAVGLFVCYLFGTAWFVIMTKCSLSAALAACVLPFLLPDAVKLFAAAALTVRLEPFGRK